VFIADDNNFEAADAVGSSEDSERRSAVAKQRRCSNAGQAKATPTGDGKSVLALCALCRVCVGSPRCLSLSQFEDG